MLVYARSDAPQHAEGVWSPRVSAGHGEAGQTAQQAMEKQDKLHNLAPEVLHVTDAEKIWHER